MTSLLSDPNESTQPRPKLEGGKRFVMETEFTPSGDQPQAIAEISANLDSGERDQVLLGATGTGKTFTMAPRTRHWPRSFMAR